MGSSEECGRAGSGSDGGGGCEHDMGERGRVLSIDDKSRPV